MLLTFEQYPPDMDEYAPTDVEVWVGSDAAYEQVEQYGGERVTQRPPNPDDVRRTVRPDTEPVVEALLSRPLERDRQCTVGGETWYVLRGERDSLPDFVYLFETTSNREVRVTARVDEAGVIRSFALQWRGEYGDETVQVQYVVRFEQLGEATAPKPSWVDRLVESTPTTTP